MLQRPTEPLHEWSADREGSRDRGRPGRHRRRDLAGAGRRRAYGRDHFCEPGTPPPSDASRRAAVDDSRAGPGDRYVRHVAPELDRYAGVNLLAGDPDELWWLQPVPPRPERLGEWARAVQRRAGHTLAQGHGCGRRRGATSTTRSRGPTGRPRCSTCSPTVRRASPTACRGPACRLPRSGDCRRGRPRRWWHSDPRPPCGRRTRHRGHRGADLGRAGTRHWDGDAAVAPACAWSRSCRARPRPAPQVLPGPARAPRALCGLWCQATVQVLGPSRRAWRSPGAVCWRWRPVRGPGRRRWGGGSGG